MKKFPEIAINAKANEPIGEVNVVSEVLPKRNIYFISAMLERTFGLRFIEKLEIL